MSLILNIETTADNAFVSLSQDERVLVFKENRIQKDHAAFLHPAIKDILNEAGKTFAAIDAVAVIAGPGSYTGIRVAMATAKGLCFALDKPMISLNRLEVMALDILQNYESDEDALYCPMIDARRMEVFTALYDHRLEAYRKPSPLIINEQSCTQLSNGHKLIIFGNGSHKCKSEPAFSNAIFVENVNLIEAMSALSFKRFKQNEFTDLILSEPIYLKDFFDGLSHK